MSLRFSEQDLAVYEDRRKSWQKGPNLTPALREAIDAANVKAKATLEDQEQEALVCWLRMKGIRHHATPNGGYRHKATAGKLKAQGVVSGFPDLTIWPHLDYEKKLPILMIEMKRVKGGQLSGEQKEWMGYFGALMALGYPIYHRVCKGCMEAIRFIEECGY